MTSPSSQVKLHLRLRAKRMVSSASKLVKKALKRSENLLTRFLSAALDDGPKKTPPPATPLEFPAFRPIGKAVAGTNLFHLYASIRKSSDITPYHVDALNLEVEHDVLLDQLIPKEFLPPQEWESDPSINPDSSAPPSSKTLSNGAAIPSHEVYHIRKKELLYSNDDGFRVLSMRPGYGRQGIKLVHFRKFWERLNAVAQYWDTSLDGDDPAVMQPFPASPDKQAMDIDEIRSEVRSTDEAAPNTSASSTKPERKDSKDTQSDDPSASPKTPYKGRRIGTGRDMPEMYRIDAVHYFLEPICWAFGCRAEAPRISPRLQLKNLLIPVRHNAVVYRSPRDRLRAKQGISEGPVMMMQCRQETEFHAENTKEGEGTGEATDLLREVAAMLLLAQERAREGKTEVKPGENKWWAEKPKWGGGAGGGKNEQVDEDMGGPEVAMPASAQLKIENLLSGPPALKKAKRLRRSPMRGTAERGALVGPHALWDDKAEYLQIGKTDRQDYDDIYAISSLNHHVAILRLRVPTAYTDFLLNGQADGHSSLDAPVHEPWYHLKLRRSRWFNLLVPEERGEAMRAVWGVLGWMMRDVGAEN